VRASCQLRATIARCARRLRRTFLHDHDRHGSTNDATVSQEKERGAGGPHHARSFTCSCSRYPQDLPPAHVGAGPRAGAAAGPQHGSHGLPQGPDLPLHGLHPQQPANAVEPSSSPSSTKVLTLLIALPALVDWAPRVRGPEPTNEAPLRGEPQDLTCEDASQVRR
jgi:hypothetical protein